MRIYSFDVWIKGREEFGSSVNATTHGQAKMQYFRILDDCYPDLPFTALRARKVGGPTTSDAFISNAKYRGMPNVKCGQRVRVGEAVGSIVGHNSSANFDVLFDKESPKYSGMRLNVHPQSVELLK